MWIWWLNSQKINTLYNSTIIVPWKSKETNPIFKLANQTCGFIYICQRDNGIKRGHFFCPIKRFVSPLLNDTCTFKGLII